MATLTEEKIAPLQAQINDKQVEVSDLTNQISKAQKDKSSYLAGVSSSKNLSDEYSKRHVIAGKYYSMALALKNKLTSKKRTVCGAGYFNGVCKQHDVWKTIVSYWLAETKKQINNRVKFEALVTVAKNLVSDLVSEKLAKQSEIKNLQEQIDQIISDDIAIAATDPAVLVAAQESNTAIAALEEEGKQRNSIIIGVIVIVIVIGSIITLRS